MTSSKISPDSPYSVNLTNCDREPIHHIAAVQSVGFLIAVTSDWRISRVSANTADFLGLPIEALLGTLLGEIIQQSAIHAVRNRLSLPNGPDSIERSFAVQLRDGGPLYDLAIHRSGELIIIEAEPHIPTGDLNAGLMVRSMLARMKGQSSLVREAARQMQALTGFDRVMIYRFHPDGSGEVVAERVRSGVEAFLGLRYPAEDIPQQARALMLRNPVRVLIDVGGETSPLVAADGSSDPIDLSMSTLRAHSLMHIEYLQNMGVGSTMTVSLVRDGSLWGMISCHHMSARHVGFEQRTTAELFGEMLSLMIEKRERVEVLGYEAHTQQLRQKLIATVVERGSIGQTITQLVEQIADLVPCDGYAVLVDGDVTLRGATPTTTECQALRGFLDEQAFDQIYATSALTRDFPQAREFNDVTAGMLVLPISRSKQDYVVFFRDELTQAVTWAGRPTKLLVVADDGPRLSPRKSFAAWREIVRGRSAPWTPAELAAAEMIRVTMLEIVLQKAGETATENRAATQKQELLIAELNHRVRNILGLIRGLVAQSRLSALDVDTFATVLGDRVHALARAHDQITAKNWGPGSLAALIATESSAFLGEGAARISVNGPATLLQPQAFSTVTLVIHELMTNAAKYGALSGGSGQVTVTWKLDDGGNLTLDWLETGGPKVSAPTRRGFGSTIIHRSIPHELGGEVTLDYEPDGLKARFVVPGRHVVPGDDTPIPAVMVHEEGLADRLSGTVLLVEDNIIIALEAEDMLLALGAESVLVASNVADALRLLTIEKPSFALLDINLGSETSWPVAARLRELGVRYVFATGYGDGIDFPLEHRQVAVVSKPYSKETIAQALS